MLLKGAAIGAALSVTLLLVMAFTTAEEPGGPILLIPFVMLFAWLGWSALLFTVGLAARWVLERYSLMSSGSAALTGALLAGGAPALLAVWIVATGNRSPQELKVAICLPLILLTTGAVVGFYVERRSRMRLDTATFD